MQLPYDIFKEFADGSVLWIEAVEDLKRARTRIQELAQHSPGKYFVFNQNHQMVIEAAKSRAAGGRG